MGERSVYMIVNLSVSDAERYREYEKGFFPLLKKYQGQFVSYDDNPETFEGVAPREGRMVVFKFPSAELARSWYADADYQALSEHRRQSTTLQFLTMVRAQ